MSASSSPQVHFRTCNLCEAMCGVRIEVADGRITSIKGDDADLFSRGHICPKAVALRDLHEDPDRLRHPMKRTASGWERVSWEDAFSDITRRLHALQQEHGPHSVGAYLGNPNVHNLGAMMFGPGLLRALRSRNRFSATSVDWHHPIIKLRPPSTQSSTAFRHHCDPQPHQERQQASVPQA
nr:molybdopterin-dependent oxidoreductase [Corallococcus llansteffanensis]